MRTIKADGQEIDIPDEVLCLVPRSGIRIDPPDGYFMIDGFVTIEYVMSDEKLPLDKWLHISQAEGGLFQTCWMLIFGDRVAIPPSLLKLRASSNDVRHMAGFIILYFEKATEARVPIFIQDPETHLHPAECAAFMCMFNRLKAFCEQICKGPRWTPASVPKGRRLNLK